MKQKEVDQSVKLRINFLQDALGFSNNRQFAMAIDMDTSQFSKIGKGDLPLSLDAAMMISKKFGVNLHWLFTGKGVWNVIPNDEKPNRLLAVQWESQGRKEWADQQQKLANSGTLGQVDRDLLLELAINQKATLQYLREIQAHLGIGIHTRSGTPAVSEVKELIKKGKSAGKDKQSSQKS